MNNINKKIIVPIFLFVFLASVIIIKISLPSYALEEINNACNHNNTSIEEAYITDDDGRVDFGNEASLSVETTGANQYSVKLLLSFNSNKKEVDITLKDGIKWISWDNETTASGIVKSVISEEYKKYETKTGNYIIQSGKKTFVIKDGIVCANLNFVIAADIPLRIEEIKEAIKIEQKYIENNEEKNNTTTLDVNIDYSKVPIEANGTSSKQNGSSIEGNYNFYPSMRLAGVFANFNDINIIYKNFEVEIETPLGVDFVDYTVSSAGYGTAAQSTGWEQFEKIISDNNIYKFRYKNVLGKFIGINPIWDFSNTKATNGQTILINVKSIKYQLYNNKEIIYKYNDPTCIEENNHDKQVLCSSTSYTQEFTINNVEDLKIDTTTTINDIDKNNTTEVIRLGNFFLQNQGITTKEKIVTLHFDSTKIGVTHVSLPAILGTRITKFKYKLEGDNLWKTDFDEKQFADPDPMRTSYSTTLGYVNFTNEMVNSEKFITDIEYIIGKIPINAYTGYAPGVLSYTGIVKKQEDGSYPEKYISNFDLKDLNGDNLVRGQSTTIVDQKNYISTCPKNKMESKAYVAGEKMSFFYDIDQCSGTYHGKSTTTRLPKVYIRIPKNLIFNKDEVVIKSYQYNSKLERTEHVISEYEINERKGDEYNIYEVSFEKDKKIYIGFPKYAQYAKQNSKITINYTVNIPSYYSDNGKKYYYYDTVFLTDSNIDETQSGYIISEQVGSIGDIYDVDNDGITDDIMTYGVKKSEYYQIKTNPDINSYLSIKTLEGEKEEIVIIKDSATVNAKIVNNSGVDNQKGTMYIPIPRKGEYWDNLMYCDENKHCSEYSYNLYLEKLIEEDEKYKIYYGKNIKPINKYNDFMNIEKWYTNNDIKTFTKEELKEINLIKIEVLDIDNNKEINVEFKVYSDEKNVKGIKYNDLSSAYYRDLKNAEGDVLTGWKKTNYVNIALGLSEEIIETPITSSEISVIVMIFAIPMMIYGMYLIWKSVKEHKDKMDK